MASSDPTRAVAPASHEGRIWLFAFGYFAAYVPYAFLTKAISDGLVPGAARVPGVALLPITTTVSALGVLAVFGASGLWRRARRVQLGALSVPFPRAVTWASGACSALIVVTTTLAYTFESTSIVTMMLLMRGGVLMLAPIVDALTRRGVRWYSWVALALSIGAVIAAVGDPTEAGGVGAWAALDAGLYLVAYFGRLGLMSRVAKRDRDTNLQFFVEEQLVATPLAVLVLSLLVLFHAGPIAATLQDGTLTVLASGVATAAAVGIGLASQGTGLFGALVLLDARESSFSVPVNRASSVLAGLVATALLALALDQPWPSVAETVGASLVLVAIAVLAIGPRLGPKA